MDVVNLNPMVAPIQPVEPSGSGGGTFIYVIVVIVLLVSLVAAGFFFYKSQSRTVIDLSKSADPSQLEDVEGPPPSSFGAPPPPPPVALVTSAQVATPEDDSSVNVEPLDTDPMSTTENYTSF